MKPHNIVLPLIFLILLSQSLLAQIRIADPQAALNAAPRLKPRMKIDAEKPGHYELVTELQRTEVDPGDSIDLTLYLSGYGNVRESKLTIEQPPIFVYDSSYMILLEWQLQYNNLGQSRPFFQYVKKTIPQHLIMTLGGFKEPTWDLTTDYIDNDTLPRSLGILTEGPQPPCSIHLLTIKDIEPGSYSFPIVYTYFNGSEWQGQQQFVTFKVKTLVERHDTLIAITGLIIAFIAIIPFLVEQIRKIFGWIKIGIATVIRGIRFLLRLFF